MNEGLAVLLLNRLWGLEFSTGLDAVYAVQD